jgi:hypothetical protein
VRDIQRCRGCFISSPRVLASLFVCQPAGLNETFAFEPSQRAGPIAIEDDFDKRHNSATTVLNVVVKDAPLCIDAHV